MDRPPRWRPQQMLGAETDLHDLLDIDDEPTVDVVAEIMGRTWTERHCDAAKQREMDEVQPE